MLAGVHALKIGEAIVVWIVVPVVNVAVFGNRAECNLPNIPMKPLAAARPISVTRPPTVQAAIEIRRKWVKDDWIGVFGARLSADFHPLSVKNI